MYKDKLNLILLAECYVNTVILYWLIRTKKPLHCEGVTKCIDKIEKIRNRGSKTIVALIDYEKNEAIKIKINNKIGKNKCREKCGNNMFKLYKCNNFQLLLFIGSPEDILRNNYKELKKFFENIKNLRKFKRKAQKYIKLEFSEKCKKGEDLNDIILKGLCTLYNLLANQVSHCIENFL